MSVLEHKIDFAAVLSVINANSNGDPLNGNRPRTDYNGFGEISDVCIKRKIRNRMQDLGNEIFVQSDDRCVDGKKNLSDRAKEISGQTDYFKAACEKWMDVRSFGQVFAFEGFDGRGVRGPVSIHQARSVSPIDIEEMQIVKSVNGMPAKKKGSTDKNDEGKSRDRMGMKHFVRFGLYLLKGSINVQLAKKTGFSVEDANVLKDCLRTLFVNDASSARPEGSMEVVKLYWWEHDCKDGKYSTAKVHRSVHVTLKEGIDVPSSVDDYVITVDELPGLEPEVIDGI